MRSNPRHNVRKVATPTQEEGHTHAVESDDVLIADQMGNRRRGCTRLDDVWNMPANECIVCDFNEHAQPVGAEGRLLARFLGTIVRKPELAPINVDGWLKMPKKDKEEMWAKVESRFFIPRERKGAIKSWVLANLGDKWRSYRSELRRKYYDPTKRIKNLVGCHPKNVLQDQWIGLLEIWNSQEFKRRSKTNQRNRALRKIHHTAGSRSFAMVEHEMKLKSGAAPSHAEVFLKTHQRKDGAVVNDVTAKAVKQMELLMSQNDKNAQDGCSLQVDPYSRVGPERPCRLLGNGSIWNKKVRMVNTTEISGGLSPIQAIRMSNDDCSLTPFSNIDSHSGENTSHSDAGDEDIEEDPSEIEGDDQTDMDEEDNNPIFTRKGIGDDIDHTSPLVTHVKEKGVETPSATSLDNSCSLFHGFSVLTRHIPFLERLCTIEGNFWEGTSLRGSAVVAAVLNTLGDLLPIMKKKWESLSFDELKILSTTIEDAASVKIKVKCLEPLTEKAKLALTTFDMFNERETLLKELKEIELRQQNINHRLEKIGEVLAIRSGDFDFNGEVFRSASDQLV